MNRCSKCGVRFSDERLTCPVCGGEPLAEPIRESESRDIYGEYETFSQTPQKNEIEQPFYYRGWFIVLAFIFFWPAGIALLVLRSRNKTQNLSPGTEKKSNGGARTVIGIILIIFGLIVATNIADATGVSDFLTTIILAGGIVTLGLALLFGGKGSSLTRKKWTRYEAFIDNRGNTKIAFIAEKLGEDENKTATKLQKMLDKGFLHDEKNGIGAYINGRYNLLVMTKDGAPIVSVEETMADEIKAENERLAKEREKERRDSAKTIEDKMILAIEDTIAKGCSEEMKDVLQKTEKSIIRITGLVKRDPELDKNKNVINMKKSYLPTGLDLLEKYQRSTTPEETKGQIMGMFSTLAKAFLNIEKQLMKHDVIDTELDIDILTQTLEREGLLDSDFDIKVN